MWRLRPRSDCLAGGAPASGCLQRQIRLRHGIRYPELWSGGPPPRIPPTDTPSIHSHDDTSLSTEAVASRLVPTPDGLAPSPAPYWDLTSMEACALAATHNFADAHNRIDISDALRARMRAGLLWQLWIEASSRPYAAIVSDCLAAYELAAGQTVRTHAEGSILLCYASSVAMSVLAASLGRLKWSVTLIEPTFDNIPDLLRQAGVRVAPVSENSLLDLGRLRIDTDCLFLTLPNNPTGFALTVTQFSDIAAWARVHNKTLLIDRSFLMFAGDSHYDAYEVLADSGSPAACLIEDTGKALPSLDEKIGFLTLPRSAAPARDALRAVLLRHHSSVLLNVSPFTLCLVREFCMDSAATGRDHVKGTVAANRRTMRDAMAGLDCPVVNPSSEVSVEVFATHAFGTAKSVARRLRAAGVAVLPCDQFYWSEAGRDSGQIRVALARPEPQFASGVEVLANCLQGSPRQSAG